MTTKFGLFFPATGLTEFWISRTSYFRSLENFKRKRTWVQTNGCATSRFICGHETQLKSTQGNTSPSTHTAPLIKLGLYYFWGNTKRPPAWYLHECGCHSWVEEDWALEHQICLLCTHKHYTQHTTAESAAHTELWNTLHMATSGFTLRNTATRTSSVHVYNFVCKICLHEWTSHIGCMVSNLFVVLTVKQNWPNLHLHTFYAAKIMSNNERVSSPVQLTHIHFTTFL
jgi:hypothetical protein